MKLYIDDIRIAPEKYQQSRTITSAIKFIAMFGEQIDEISIDHDISYAVEVAGTQRPFPSPEDFTAVAYYIVEYYTERKNPNIIIHSANPVGAKTLEDIFTNAGFNCEYKPASRVNRLENEV